MDIKALKERIDSLDPNTHEAFRNALTAEYSRLTGKTSESEPRNGPDLDILLSIFQKAVDEINKRYIEGIIVFISRYHPELDRQISRAESAMNDIWFKCERGKVSIGEFKAKVGEWYRLNLKAIDIYTNKR